MEGSVFDPDDLTRVGSALAVILRAELGSVSVADGPKRVGNGLDTYIYGFQLAEAMGENWQKPLILRVFAAPHQEEKARRETGVQEFLSRAGFPAPRPLLVGGAGNELGLPFMIMERVPGSPMLDRFKNSLAIPRLLRQMADLHVRLHRSPLDGCPLPYEGPLVDRRLTEVRGLIERFGLSDLAEPLAWLEAHRDIVAAEEPAMLHNDFHPLNVMLSDEGEMHVLDWSDAAVGDRHHDLARTLALFWLAPPLARSMVERLLLTAVRGYLISRYLARYTEQLSVDTVRLRYWQALHAAMAWAQVATIAEGRGEELGAKPEAAEQIPPGFARSLQTFFWKRARPA